MAAQARGLGKGLGALIPTEPTKLKTSITTIST